MANQIKLWTSRDVLFGQVLRYTMNGWPVEVDHNLKSNNRKAELSFQDECLVRGKLCGRPTTRMYVLLFYRSYVNHTLVCLE